jgi:DNA adenine methylase
MANQHIPHPIPYQGSKRKLSPTIAAYITSTYEPFAGSAAFSLYAAKHNLAKQFVIGDTLEPLIALWKRVVAHPDQVSRDYEQVWRGQQDGNDHYFNTVRDEYNHSGDPVLLLYLIARCVKNAVRFNRQGKFTQSRDKRRLGMHPDKLREAVHGASELLFGRVTFFVGDFESCLRPAQVNDLVYLDPPYQGTTYGRDKRYYKQVEVERLSDVLRILNDRQVPFLLSYDGLHGDKEYGSVLPADLLLQRKLLNAGRSSQATLHGRQVTTYESLYLSSHFQADADVVPAEDRVAGNPHRGSAGLRGYGCPYQ